MAIFSGTGVVGAVTPMRKDGRDRAAFEIAACYEPKTSRRAGQWIEIVLRGELAERLASIKEKALVEFHLSNLQVSIVTKGGVEVPKLSGLAVNLRIIG